MRKKTLPFISLGLVALLWMLNFVANALYLYWTSGWYDYMMHLLGGLSIGCFVAWLLWRFLGTRGSGWMIFVAVMAIGIGWEIFEYTNNITFATEGYVLDTVHDLLMDALGAWGAILLSRRVS